MGSASGLFLGPETRDFVDFGTDLCIIAWENTIYHAAKLLVIPNQLRREIILACRDHHLAGHIKYWWPLLKSKVIEYIETCDPCMRRKRIYNFKKATVHIIPESVIFEDVHADALSHSPGEATTYILIFIDRFQQMGGSRGTAVHRRTLHR